MERFVKGDLVVVDFPVSDLTTTIKRPALVVAELGDDRILCQITSQYKDNNAIEITRNDCEEGGLNRTCNVRPGKIFTAGQTAAAHPAAETAGHARRRRQVSRNPVNSFA